MGTFWQWLNGANGGGYEGGFDEGKKLADEHDNLAYDDYTWAIDKAKETFNGDEEFQQGFEDGYNHTSFWDWLNRK